jgi:hypothetical protein
MIGGCMSIPYKEYEENSDQIKKYYSDKHKQYLVDVRHFLKYGSQDWWHVTFRQKMTGFIKHMEFSHDDWLKGNSP